ncbi:hypothetical protein GLOIN_2v1766372 [Rhizophagus irregularis DAOM 181602=DAOM 197198]|uniref:Uncharacterized protein n=1 Tax=Rhizophagus irregularis (strain DAOM 181602 / DAOM 197198 / MUCL 43194) TaxID=747089 RepID=A0A2P4QM75_RHIID|nr:hypothetical protein GLOIN_2v1766372 [Rhizophagus irregularis DAOM 181602=DAOM 197198]POG78757.1 hypothetical protein GLOIN_2v1766372 [Rhizophagus irregularis DAOM 181602=DAOM 197198]|eukprot:XP_025185623.1 hypothetical protein GLOIN_2v1766372 [Rhizophagus irregularis DAOM 181602=DAOM 197198]
MALITLSSSGATTWSSCYGCVFDWVGWVMESNGTIVEIEADLPEKQRNDFLISVKESQKKHHNTFQIATRKKQEKK